VKRKGKREKVKEKSEEIIVSRCNVLSTHSDCKQRSLIPCSPFPTPFYLFFLLFSLFSFTPLFSASLNDLVGVEMAGLLRSDKEPITEVQQKVPSPRLLPQHDELRHFIAENQKSLEPNILVETISLYAKPSPQNAWSRAEQTSLFNQLAALSTLAGIQYYSDSRKTMRTFYETSRIIDDPSSKRQLSDPVFSVLPSSLVLYARQKDLTFGDNIYCYHFHTGADYIFFMQENMTMMNAGIIPAVGKNNFRTIIAVIDSGDSLVIYAAAMAKAVSIPGMGDRIGASFSNRAIAILQWFSGRANKVF